MSEQLITLEQFIKSEIVKLSDVYKIISITPKAVLLNNNSTSESYISGEINLTDYGKQVQLSELPTIPSLPFKENGYSIKFGVVPKGKRKELYITRYFLVDEVK